MDFQSFDFGPLGTQLSGKVVLKGTLTGSKVLHSRMAKYDAVIDTGAGDSFTDIYGLKRLAIMLYTRRVAQSAGVPVILSPQTIGPFNSALGRLAARHTLKRAETVFVRDSTSLDYARKLGYEPDCLSTDVVFALPQPDSTGSKSADIALNVSGLLWSTDAHGSRFRYQELTRDIIGKLIAANRSITLMPHVIDNPSLDNDMTPVKDLVSEFGDQVEVFVPAGLDEVRAFVADCQVVIGARMHACLNALSVGTPAIPLAYSRKFAPLLADIGWAHTIDLKEEHVAERVVKLLDLSGLQAEAARVKESAEYRLQIAVSHLATQARI
ncbi:polysaccharide pyruvyl transferase family protein [Arthrobacter sp. B2a2-09]|uniref:polysaccharide pyruvyl transferase family protein n=1 Tax=Arthrobacter sp. B2a2-09 TaxID=2952822 RepID=UPI0022CD5A0F|nr:polysaccharide pyruvyl transferase family protein [Arthrobacter sp. B2a2-09]MCZ9882312.1 polysaccharide pyruvyl transferase family protein [Arthrobacter sp. B2a2-09]